jgi:hypothetical protein
LVSANKIYAQKQGEINVTNYTGKRITYIYAANNGKDNWSKDILLRGALNDGSDINLQVPAELGKTGLFDLKTVYADGTEFVWDQLDFYNNHFFTMQPLGFINIR